MGFVFGIGRAFVLKLGVDWVDSHIILMQEGAEESISQKQLYALHQENERLRREKQEDEVKLEEHNRRTTELLTDLAGEQRRNQSLEEEAREATRRVKNMEDQLGQLSEAYKSLYNFVYSEEQVSSQQLVMKEIDITNQFVQLREKAALEKVESLEGLIKTRNQEIIALRKKQSELENSLLTSSYEYQETIHSLKLQHQQEIFNANLSTKQLEEEAFIDHTRINEAVVKKLQICAQEAQILRSQLQQERNLCSELEKVVANYTKTEKEDGHEKLTVKELEEMILQNQSLKQQLRVERGQPQTSELREQEQLHQSYLEAEYRQFRIVAGRAFDKLKYLLREYVPCSKLYGFENYGFDKEEQILLTESTAKDENQRCVEEIKSKNAQISQLQKDYQKVSEQLEFLRRITSEIQIEFNEKTNEILRLAATVDMLMDKPQQEPNDYQEYIEQQFGQSSPQPSPEEEEESSPVPSVVPPQGSSSVDEQPAELEGDVLEVAVKQLQSERAELVGLVRQRQIKLAEAYGEIRALRAHKQMVVCKVLPSSQTINRSVDSSHLNQHNFESYQQEAIKLRQDLRVLRQEYEDQRRQAEGLLKREVAKWQSKHDTLLQRYSELERLYKEERVPKHTIPSAMEEEGPDVQDKSQPVQEEMWMEEGEQQVASQSTLSTISELLHKYEKEFSRFVAVYEARARRLREVSGEEEIYSESEGQLNRLEKLLEQTQNMSRRLQEALQKKEEETKQERQGLQSALKAQDERVKQLEGQLTAREKSLLQLQSSQQNLGEIEGQGAKATFLLIDSKNKEMSALKKTEIELRRQTQSLNQRIRELQGREYDSMSALERQEYGAMRKILIEGGLLSLLQELLTEQHE